MYAPEYENIICIYIHYKVSLNVINIMAMHHDELISHVQKDWWMRQCIQKSTFYASFHALVIKTDKLFYRDQNQETKSFTNIERQNKTKSRNYQQLILINFKIGLNQISKW